MEQDDPLDWEGGEQTRVDGEPIGVDWDKIAHAYIHGEWSLAWIADAYGSSERTISARAKTYGWVRLVGTKRLPSGRRTRLPGAKRPTRANVDQMRRRTIIRRCSKCSTANWRSSRPAWPKRKLQARRIARPITSATGAA